MLKKNYSSLIILLIIFILPGIAAYVVYNNPKLIAADSTNHGDFIKPPIYIAELANSKKWHLVYFAKTGCQTRCMGNIDKLARIRLALGRQVYDVDGYLMLPSTVKSLNLRQAKILQDINIFVLKLDKNKQGQQQLLAGNYDYYIINPEGYAVLGFVADSASEDIFQDLKKLVNN